MYADPLVARLAGIVGHAHVLADADLRAPFETDWTRRFRGRARLVVRPGTTAEVAGTVQACADAGVALVPQGGNTGLVGGGVPRGGEVVLVTSRLDGLTPVDVLAGQITVGAGTPLAVVQAHVAAAGFEVGVDLAARDTATVGGMVATNAGGLHAIRHGSMRARVAGVEAVLAGGQVVSHLGGLAKDNTGYDLAGLLTGSEGTLGIVTRVRLRLVPRSTHRTVALLGLPDVRAALELAVGLRASLPWLEALEFVDAPAQRCLLAHTGLPAPVPGDHGVWLLVACAGPHDPLPELAEALAGAGEAVAVAQDRAERGSLWAYRERATEAISAVTVPHKLDVSVPLAALADFTAAVPAAVARVAPDAEVLQFGHLGDGNVHVNVLGVDASDDDPGGERVDDAVLRLVADRGGSISAEHGVGVAKTRWLHLSRSPEEIAAMRAIKHALDPAALLNPGVLLGDEGAVHML